MAGHHLLGAGNLGKIRQQFAESPAISEQAHTANLQWQWDLAGANESKKHPATKEHVQWHM